MTGVKGRTYFLLNNKAVKTFCAVNEHQKYLSDGSVRFLFSRVEELVRWLAAKVAGRRRSAHWRERFLK